MAAQFPPNFNDGERFLMDDFFFNPLLRRHQHRHNRLCHRHLPCVDVRSPTFTALSLLQRLENPNNFELERFKTPVQSGPLSVRPEFPSHIGANRGRELEQRIHEYGAGSFSSGYKRVYDGSFSSGYKPVYDVQFLKQTPAQERNNRVLQRKQNHLVLQNRGLPCQGSGFGFNGGLLRDYGGTGVFHPRINTYTTGVSIASVAKNQSVEYRKNIWATQQKNSMKRSAKVPSNQGEYHLPPDIGLPRDWTY